MKHTGIMVTALLLMVAAYPLASYATSNNSGVLVWVSLALLTVGGLIPPALRFMGGDGPDDDGDDSGNRKENAR